MKEIIGIWQTDPEDIVSQQLYGNAIMEFRGDGSLIYKIKGENRDQIIYMTYEIKDNFLITNQPLNPREEITEFILNENSLLLIYYNIGVDDKIPMPIKFLYYAY
jgi:hypothetical protein